VIYNSGRYRMAGAARLAGLMPYGDANAIVMEMAREVLPVVKKTPVLAGVCATDPFRLMDELPRRRDRAGFSGVQNFPTVGLIDGVFRQNLEETGMSYALEVDMIAMARALDLLTTPYVFSEADATAMARAGADIIVVPSRPDDGRQHRRGDGAKARATARRSSTARVGALAVKPGRHRARPRRPRRHAGGRRQSSSRTPACHGFYGASSMERLPAETALTEQTRAFKRIKGR
jgi:predicted TIM-barrel enzyme